ncbi:MAG: hypothetical protein F4Z03_11465, partial [Gemmatimonadetes bacterium]|nr:hypothetical protein [Gemmatimonadota bacterium]
MSDKRQNGEESKGLVGMFTAERQREQDNTMDRRIEKKRFTPRRIALGGLVAAVIAFGAYALLSVNPSSLNV